MPKTHSRIEAYGTIDELNAFVACLLEEIEQREDRELLLHIQYNLFSLGACLATDSETPPVAIDEQEITLIEQAMDAIDTELPDKQAFILPGGCKANALAHVCRTVCRRAERAMYRLAETEFVPAVALQYINRLSDFFFLFSRKQNIVQQLEEIIWKNPCK